MQRLCLSILHCWPSGLLPCTAILLPVMSSSSYYRNLDLQLRWLRSGAANSLQWLGWYKTLVGAIVFLGLSWEFPAWQQLPLLWNYYAERQNLRSGLTQPSFGGMCCLLVGQSSMTCWYGCRSPNGVERKQDCIGGFDRDFGTGVVADVA